MNTIEHLQLIKAECERLLALSEKRTQGEWSASDYVVCGERIDGFSLAMCSGQKTQMSEDAYNATYIAACAGRAEAGWTSTIRQADFLIDLIEAREEPFYGAAVYEANRLASIWHLELLQRP